MQTSLKKLANPSAFVWRGTRLTNRHALRLKSNAHAFHSGKPCFSTSSRSTPTHSVLARLHTGSGSGLLRALGGIGIISLAIVSLSSLYNSETVHLDKSANAPQTTDRGQISYDDLSAHNTPESAWILVNGKVYDVTEFLKKHPGGSVILLNHSGKDSTSAYSKIHPERFLSSILPSSSYIGDIDPSSLPKSAVEETEEEKRIRKAHAGKPPLAAMISLDDFAEVAHSVLTDTAWGYYSSSAEEGSSYEANFRALKNYEFRPRCLMKTAGADPTASFLGITTPIPFFASPCAAAGLGHPEGEVSIARGAGRAGLIQILSSMATRSQEDVAAARQPGQTQFYQIYIHPNWKKSEADIKRAEQLGYKAVFLTVDTTHLGKREADMRAKALVAVTILVFQDGDDSQLGVARQMGDFYDQNLGWDVVPWIKSVTKLPVVLKGIQCVEDVELAYEHGVAGVVLSNHGGRQLAYAPAGIDILYELQQRRPDLLKKMDVFVDGGVRRGTDVVKALCLGAKGVGIGRPFLYANSSYGEDGIVKAVDVMKDEVVRTMRLLGVSKVEDLRPEMVVRRHN
ncbi:hypothetical protein DL93DRAFT_2067004 [Clavulina sp. PMI_390]|nr:hypothetical protein DL93DRAFT_2067004 [Clavulina sp. PMI_390]